MTVEEFNAISNAIDQSIIDLTKSREQQAILKTLLKEQGDCLLKSRNETESMKKSRDFWIVTACIGTGVALIGGAWVGSHF